MGCSDCFSVAKLYANAPTARLAVLFLWINFQHLRHDRHGPCSALQLDQQDQALMEFQGTQPTIGPGSGLQATRRRAALQTNQGRSSRRRTHATPAQQESAGRHDAADDVDGQTGLEPRARTPAPQPGLLRFVCQPGATRDGAIVDLTGQGMEGTGSFQVDNPKWLTMRTYLMKGLAPSCSRESKELPLRLRSRNSRTRLKRRG